MFPVLEDIGPVYADIAEFSFKCLDGFQKSLETQAHEPAAAWTSSPRTHAKICIKIAVSRKKCKLRFCEFSGVACLELDIGRLSRWRYRVAVLRLFPVEWGATSHQCANVDSGGI